VPTTANSKSTTQASIAHGSIITRDGATDLSALSRDCLLDSQALKPIFDEEKGREKIELGQVKIRTCCDENRNIYSSFLAGGPAGVVGFRANSKAMIYLRNAWLREAKLNQAVD